MAALDWIVLLGTLGLIVTFGFFRNRRNKDLNEYLKGGNSDKWYSVGLGVMATQASAITFLSATGQGYESGLGFVQIYFGLPLAMILICAVIIPIYYRLNVFTAYEYLEERFNLPTRLFVAALFLLSRGLSTGITLFAPSIVLSTLFGWPLSLTNILIGVLVILYTVSGGSKAVGVTQKQQLFVIFLGMFIAFYLILDALPEEVGFSGAMHLAGLGGKLEAVNTAFDTNTRYTLWSGLLGGFFLSLSYFGTDQSQVQRYITATNTAQSRIGLLFNALLKIPMQFFILSVGVLLFAYYLFHAPPAHFNSYQLEMAKQTGKRDSILLLENQLLELDLQKQVLARKAYKGEEESAFMTLDATRKEKQKEFRGVLSRALSKEGINDTDYVFLHYVLNQFPAGLVGLLLAVILCAAMGALSGGLNSLASTTVVDFYRRLGKKSYSDAAEVRMSRWFTLLWGVIAIVSALSASLFENLIELVNIIGSLFYGTILGVFVCGFFLKKLRGKDVFPAAILAEAGVLICYMVTDWSFLWLNPVGCLLVVFIALFINRLRK